MAIRPLCPASLWKNITPEAVDLKCYTFEGQKEFIRVIRMNKQIWVRTDLYHDTKTLDIRSKPFEGPIELPP